MNRYGALLFLCAGAGASLAIGQAITGCDDTGDHLTPDAGDGRDRAEPIPLKCQGDPGVMMRDNGNGGLEMADWGCYDPDAAFLDPIVTIAALDAGADADDGSTAADADMDSAAPVDAGEDSAAPVDAGGMVKFHLVDFIARTPVGGGNVDIFYGNDITAAPSFSGTSAGPDGGLGGAGYGDFFFPPPPAPGTLTGVHVHAAGTGPSALHDVIWLSNVMPGAGHTYEGASITEGSIQLLAAGIGASTKPGTMIITMGARDCQYRDVQGATVEVIDEATGQPLPPAQTPTDPRFAYFDVTNLPNTACTHTVAQPALFAGINVPTDKSLTVRVSGIMHPGEAPKVLGEKHLTPVPDKILIDRPYRLNTNQATSGF
jgi:hypothetical protein